MIRKSVDGSTLPAWSNLRAPWLFPIYLVVCCCVMKFLTVPRAPLKNLVSLVATPAAPYRSLPGPPGPESRKSRQRVSRGLSALGPKSVRDRLEKVSRVSKQSILTLRKLFRDCFGHFFGPRGRKATGDSLVTLSGLWARRARETPVRGGWGCNSLCGCTFSFMVQRSLPIAP